MKATSSRNFVRASMSTKRIGITGGASSFDRPATIRRVDGRVGASAPRRTAPRPRPIRKTGRPRRCSRRLPARRWFPRCRCCRPCRCRSRRGPGAATCSGAAARSGAAAGAASGGTVKRAVQPVGRSHPETRTCSCCRRQSRYPTHQPSSKPDRPAVFASTHVKEPELLWQTWPPHAVSGQSLSVVQVVCASARPVASRIAKAIRKDNRTEATGAFISRTSKVTARQPINSRSDGKVGRFVRNAGGAGQRPVAAPAALGAPAGFFQVGTPSDSPRGVDDGCPGARPERNSGGAPGMGNGPTGGGGGPRGGTTGAGGGGGAFRPCASAARCPGARRPSRTRPTRAPDARCRPAARVRCRKGCSRRRSVSRSVRIIRRETWGISASLMPSDASAEPSRAARDVLVLLPFGRAWARASAHVEAAVDHVPRRDGAPEHAAEHGPGDERGQRGPAADQPEALGRRRRRWRAPPPGRRRG